MNKKLLGVSFAALMAIPGFAAETAAGIAAKSDYKWSNVAMGGGGFVSAVIASPLEKGLFYARTDVGGAYRWDDATARWISLMDWVDVSERGLLGVEAIAVDPKDPDVVYMMTGTSYWNNGRTAFLRSKDKGNSWDVIYTWDVDGTKGTKVENFGAHGNGMGRGNGEALAIDPNDSKIMFYGSKNKGLWKSTNNGTTWSHVDAWTKAAGSDTTWNGSGFSFVQYAPGSSKVLYAGFLREGTVAGGFENVFTSTDGGDSWKALQIPDSLRKTKGGSIVRLMPQRAVVSNDGATMTVTFADGAGPHSMMWDEGWGMIYDGFGRGSVLQCDIATGSWKNVSPENLMDDGGDATYDAVDVKGMVDCNAAGKSSKECETSYPYLAPYGGIAINPNDDKEMVVTTEGYRGPQFWYKQDENGKDVWSDRWGSNIYHTTDGGETWVASFRYYWMEGGVYPTTQQMDANGVGWMFDGSIHWAGSVAIDPFDHNRVFLTSGNGLFRTDNMTDYEVVKSENSWEDDKVTMNQVWHFAAQGVEETVPFEVVSIPGGPMISVIGDYDGFRHDDISKFPQFRHTTDVSGTGVPLGTTQGLAYAYKAGKLVKVANARKYEGKYSDVPIEPLQFSSDSGKTWTVGTYCKLDEKIANGTAAISTDGDVALFVPMEGSTSIYRYSNAAYTEVTGIDNGSFVVGDPENADVFYAYNKTEGKFFKSSDKGESFAEVGAPGKSVFKKFRAIPGYEGDLWLPVAEQDPSTGVGVSGSLQHSTDGGKTWTAVKGVGYCEAVGFGAPKTKGGYPAIYVFATIDGVTGVFGSDDKGETWSRVNDDGHEFGGLANGEFIMGDMNTYGVVYMSTAGRGIAARVPTDWSMTSSTANGSTTAIAPAVAKVSNAGVRYTRGNLDLTLTSASARVAVYDMQGKQLFSRTYSHSASIPVKSLVNAKGSYFVRIVSGNKVLFNNRIVVNK